MLFSEPGSMTMYTTSLRHGLPTPSDCPKEVGPASYNLKPSIVPLTEIVAPFHTSEECGKYKYNNYPSPLEYNPWERPRYERGTPLIGGQGVRFPEERHCTLGPGPSYLLPDPWAVKTKQIYHDTSTRRPRVKYEKFVSNNVPSIFNPLDMHSFIKGVDGRMYPWWRNRKARIPGTKYYTGEIYTSKSPGPFIINFGKMASRRPLFPQVPGFGPADFNTRRPLNKAGGIFLSETAYHHESIPRLFDNISRESFRARYPSPWQYHIIHCFDKTSPKAVMAPFKSSVPTLGFPKKELGPGPAAHFQQTMTIYDIDPPVFPYSKTKPPEKAPFNITGERFFDMACVEETYRPDPCEYTILGLSDQIKYKLKRQAAAVPNPKLGFLTSAPARPDSYPLLGTHTLSKITHTNEPYPPGREWRNIHPRNPKTYPYHGVSPRKPSSPGPIYDTATALKAIKGKKSWWNPRDFTGTGFGNSGCGRKINLNLIDKDNPGPKYPLPSFIPGPKGRVNMTEPRFKPTPSLGPGPRHKLHEKSESVWRATQLGTYNVYLKGIGGLHPNSGGFHPQGPIDSIADCVQGFDRVDDYAEDLVPTNILD